MEPIKRYLFLFLLLGTITCSSQNYIPRKGLIKSLATISPSKMLAYNESYFYIHGNIEGYLSDRVSVAGDGYSFLGEQGKAPEAFKNINNLFFGINYHFIKGNGDFFLGMQPGICIAKLDTLTPKISKAHTGTSPVFSSTIGYNYFVGKYFNFFVQARYIAGSFNYDLHKSLSEIRFSAGLGFNINTGEKKE